MCGELFRGRHRSAPDSGTDDFPKPSIWKAEDAHFADCGVARERRFHFGAIYIFTTSDDQIFHAVKNVQEPTVHLACRVWDEICS